MSDFFRVFVEKKAGHDSAAAALTADMKETLGSEGLNRVRIVNIYEVTGLRDEALERVVSSVFSEATSDRVSKTPPVQGVADFFGVEYLPGQFDQRADSAAQCIHLVLPEWDGVVRSSRLILLEGSITPEESRRIREYCINPVESREKDLTGHSLFDLGSKPGGVPVLTGFTSRSPEELESLRKEMGLAMSSGDLTFCRDYFRDQENRDPSETEIRVLDTYWSDHCRHTTFETELRDITFPEGRFQEVLSSTFENYLSIREKTGRTEKPLTLMDLATISARRQRADGLLDDMEVSEEINACSVRIKVDVDGREEPWLLMFKNETHNHPTEIEPFGGASTCIGGAIRDPLSGRSFVYQAMRITGSADPRETLDDTQEGKLPQKYISRTAAHGYSSYGNQIGLATTFVREIYDPGYKAKRMEVGAVAGAVPEGQVRRESPLPGDTIILIGGKTGRDGCGGATGSSKEHTSESLQTCSAEVQKGNAPEERKIQRLFRDPAVTALIKKCNDFGAGGVAVAIGELSDGLEIDLDRVPVKYSGLNGTELAISESQERMAVVTAPEDAEKLIRLAAAENLEAVHVADVTDRNRLVMTWQGRPLVDLDRSFLDTNGVRAHAGVTVPDISNENPFSRRPEGRDEGERFLENLRDLNVCSQRGLTEMFDASIGAGTVHMPYGGKKQLSESEASVQKLPVPGGRTKTCSFMAFGFDPDLFRWSPYHGSLYSVISSLARLAASGGNWRKARLSFQEYFRRLGEDPSNWGLPFGALLGALEAQEQLNIPAIGGKDSMSGSFHEIHVPPTLISFAVTTGQISHTVSSEWKMAGSTVYCLPMKKDDALVPDWENFASNMDFLAAAVGNGKILSAATVKAGGIAEGLFKMAAGNGIGFDGGVSGLSIYDRGWGDILFESAEAGLEKEYPGLIRLGCTVDEPRLRWMDMTVSLDECTAAWKQPLDPVFPDYPENGPVPSGSTVFRKGPSVRRQAEPIRPLVYLPVFPGTNCEYDTEGAFRSAGADTRISVFRNRDRQDVRDSLNEMVHQIDRSQILMISGGFSAGDEPEGSGKFIANVLKNPGVAEAIGRLLERDGLILGICNGFQALIKSGLLPFGEVRDVPENAPTLARNRNNRHISRMVTTRVTSNLSPWTAGMEPGDQHEIAISHGEGRFTASPEVLRGLEERGQIVFRYCSPDGSDTMSALYNPNGSDLAVEGITSPDGRILGKMGHTERFTGDNFRNIPGRKFQPLFSSGVNYFLKG